MQLIRGRYNTTPDDVSAYPLALGNCGAYLSWKKDKHTLREAGRRDWQLICVTEGRGFFRFDGEPEETEVPSRHIVLFMPGERQDYRFRREDAVSFWWVHFSGTDCVRLLTPLREKGRFVRVGDTAFFSEICRRMLSEFRAPEGASELFLAGLLAQLFACCEKAAARVPRLDDAKIREAIDRMNETVGAPLSVVCHADACGWSVSRFAHRFAEVTGMPPGEYMTHLAVEKAKDLLTIGELNVSETADALGFPDPFYFSRVFKKITGVPPSVYRRR